MKKPKLGIFPKIFFSIMFVATILVGIISVFALIFLEDYFKNEIQNEMIESVQELETAILTRSVLNYRDISEAISQNHSMCIDVSYSDGMSLVRYEGLGLNCPIHINEMESTEDKFILIEEAMKTNDYTISMVQHYDNQAMYYACTKRVNVPIGGTFVITSLKSLDDINSTMNIVQDILLIITAVMFILSIVVALVITRSLVRPITVLTKAVDEVSCGNLEVKADVEATDEIGHLATRFNNMATKLSVVDKVQKELIANISHDIRTPLTMIKGYAETIKDITGEKKEVRDSQLDIIIEESNRLSNLVGDALDLSLLQSGGTDIKFDIFDLSKVATDILNRFEIYKNDGFKFELNVVDNAYVSGDEIRIQQALYNLIFNAITHCGENKSVKLKVVKEGVYYIISVIDTGTGIEQEQLPYIFDRYYKSYKKKAPTTSGTGLGLSIFKAIMQAHNTVYGVNSVVGEGSEFYFRLKSVNSSPSISVKNDTSFLIK